MPRASPTPIVIPPPNVTGALHLGHAINNTLQDILTAQGPHAGLERRLDPRHRPRRHRHAGGGGEAAQGERRTRPATTSAARSWSSGSGMEGAVRRPHPRAAQAAWAARATGIRTRFTLDEQSRPRRPRDVLQAVQGRPDLPRQTAGELGHPAADLGLATTRSTTRR